MGTKKEGKVSIIVMISIILFLLIVILEVLSSTLFSEPQTSKLLCRMISRGLFGILFLYHSIYLMFTNKQYFLSKNLTGKHRRLCGFLICIVSLGLIITAFLGYGTNGDPRYLWWK